MPINLTFPGTYCMIAHGAAVEISDPKSNLLRNRCSGNITYFGESGGVHIWCVTKMWMAVILCF